MRRRLGGLAALTLVMALAACGGSPAPVASTTAPTSVSPSPPARTSPSPASPSVSPEFPVTVSANRRHLVDRQGRPFFLTADTGWQVFANVDAEAAAFYLDQRRQAGFNTIQAYLVNWDIRKPNAAGVKPFHDDDISRPNDRYFDHVDRVLRMGAERGLLMTIGPIELDSSFDRVTPENLAAYGQYLGRRYRSFDNLIWMLGGDRNADGRVPAVRALAAALLESDDRHLMTYHPRERSSSAWFHDDAWLSFNMFQSGYFSMVRAHTQVIADYRRTPVKPVLDGEHAYEQPGVADALQVRRGAYWAVLSGALGVVYGGYSVFLMDDDGAERGWRESLDLPGVRHVHHLRRLMESSEWHRLVPDHDHRVVTHGFGGEGREDYAPAARADDGSRVIVYLPSRRDVTVDLSNLSGPGRAFWFDPTTGTRQEAGGPFESGGFRAFSPPASNAAGEPDFVLIIEATRG